MRIRTRFRVALAVASDPSVGDYGQPYTARDFARDHDVSTTVLHEVLRGVTSSARLQAEIEAFIDDMEARLQPTLASTPSFAADRAMAA